MSRVLVGQERNHSGPRFGDGPWTRSYATSPHATLALGHGISTPLSFTFFTIFTSTVPPYPIPIAAAVSPARQQELSHHAF
jgi:hypothetical protein